MSLPTSYMTGSFSKIPQYFEAMLTAKAPEKFTTKFMSDLGFTSSNDRQFINVLKVIGFLDDSGTPSEKYFKFLDQSCSKYIVAEGIRNAYEDLFNLNKNANTLSKADVEGKFKTLTNGSKGNATISQMASTFTNLCAYADWSIDNKSDLIETKMKPDIQQSVKKDTVNDITERKIFDLNYDIHIHLPATRDQAVYDALFASLTKHIPLK